MRGRLSEIRALARVGRVADGIKAVAALEADARPVGYAPLLAEVLLVSGTMHLDVSDFETGIRALEDAVWTAELCRHDEVAAEAATSLVFATGHAQSRFDAGEIWSRHAETVLARMGGHEIVRGWLFNNRSAMRGQQGRLRDAVEDVQRAIEAKEKALGPNDPDVGISLVNAAVYLDDLGETVRAAAYIERAVQIMQETLGRDHPKVAITLANYAELLNRLGRYGEALEPAGHALVGARARDRSRRAVRDLPAGGARAAATSASGSIARRCPAWSARRAFARTRRTAPHRIGEAHFALGRALWGSGQDRARALALVEQRARRVPRHAADAGHAARAGRHRAVAGQPRRAGGAAAGNGDRRAASPPSAAF